MNESDIFTYGSLFTGVEGFDLGFNNAGMKCLWQVEIDKHCQAVLRHNSPNTEKFTDVKKSGKENLRPVDLICGGFPCQDLSLAGKRKGLAGERSGLWYEFARIIAELKPPWVVIENVPGLLSSNKGEDFAIILRWLGECGYYASWRVFDSQYWGVAQRRRRLFIVGSLGNAGCTEILFESEGLPWNPAKGKKKRAGITQAITGRLGGGGPDDNKAQGGFYVAHGRNKFKAGEIAGPQRASGRKQSGVDLLIPKITGTLSADYYKQGGNAMGEMANGLIAATETGAGFWTEGKPGLRCSTAPSQPQTIVLTCGDRGISPDQACGGMVQAVCLNPKDPQTKRVHAGTPAPTLSGSDGKGGQRTPHRLMPSMAVRRLTPRECERLQGFPDDWTRYGVNEKGEKIEISDSQRYKVLGNAVTRNVPEWMGKRIVRLHGRH